MHEHNPLDQADPDLHAVGENQDGLHMCIISKEKRMLIFKQIKYTWTRNAASVKMIYSACKLQGIRRSIKVSYSAFNGL